MKKRYPIEIIDSTKDIIYYPEGLHLQGTERIAYGTFAQKATFLPHPKKSKGIAIARELAKKLKLPELNSPLHLFLHEDTLHLGPLVGIFTSGFTPFSLKPIGERTLFFSKLLSVEKLVGAHAYIFGEEHINWEHGTIQGLFFHKGQWNSIEVPFPNVIYDRLPNRRSEKKTKIAKIKERLQQEYLIPWYNPGFFNKMDVYERLQQDELSVQYLPETHPLTSFSLVERMLADYGHVFIKPTNGSLGLGVYQIIYDRKSGDYYCRYRDSKSGENKLRKYQTLEGLFKHILHNRKLNQFLVQQGIHSMRLNRGTVDFRIHTNKDEQGNWKVTALAAKVAKAGNVTPHINNGGEIKTIGEIFETKDEQIEAIKKLKNACFILSHALEEHLDGVIGEIGFDMGMDRDGNVWLFEANSKPGRSIFKHPHLKEFDLLTRKLSLAFSIFLTEQSLVNPEGMFR